MTATQHTWTAAGQPPHGYPVEPAPDGRCATCGGAHQDGHAVPLAAIETPTMAAHGDNFRTWGKHVCHACAWLYQAGKGRPGNFIALPDRYEETVISLDSVVANKRPWITILRELATLPPETPITGVMTTDVKPRLWPRMRLTTLGQMGLYLHAPDYDVSAWTRFDLHACLDAIGAMLPALAAGYPKARLYHGLWTDGKRAIKDPAATLALETAIAPHRGHDHFLPALIAAGLTKEAKANVQRLADQHPTDQPGASADRHTQPAPASRDQHRSAQLELF